MDTAFASMVLAAVVALGGGAQDEGEQGAQDVRGVLVRKSVDERFRFVRWESEESVNRIFRALKGRPGAEVHFLPGTYTVHQGFVVADVPDLTISGAPGVTIEFAPAPAVLPRTTAPVEPGASTILVDHPEGLQPGWNYQLYAPNGRGDRLLEFTIASIEGNEVELLQRVRFMPHVKEIPSDCRVLEEVNGFQIKRCPGITIQNLTLDGHERGDVRGHTIYSGIINTGLYRERRRPTTVGMTVRGCTFRGLMGRGIAFYGVAGARIEGNSFHRIRAQAIEIDHFSSGHVLNNHVDGAEVGVTINDAFESLVEGNVLRNCRYGIRFMDVISADWVNTGNVVRDNQIGPGCKLGVEFRDPMQGNVVRGNRFLGLAKKDRVVNAEGNTVD